MTCIDYIVLYVNDVVNALNGVKVQLYADDTVILASGEDLNALTDLLQYNLCKFETWCNANKLTLNPSKTKMVAFGTRHSVKKAKQCSLFLEGRKIQCVPTFRYLGFVVDSTLNFKSHVADVIKKVMHKKLLLSKIMPYLNRNVAVTIYKTMILPYFDYCDVVYSTACAGDLEKLQRLQNKCLKMCLGVQKRESTAVVHQRSKCAYLGPRRKAHLCNFMYARQSRNGLLDEREIHTRQHDAPTFVVPFPDLECSKRSVAYNGAITWNALPTAMRQIDCPMAFKFRQKKSMFGDA